MSYKIFNNIYKLNSIINVTKRQRLFCILDKEFPWELEIEHICPHTDYDLGYVFGKGLQLAFVPVHKHSKIDTFRMTKLDCIKHENCINKYLDIISEYENKKIAKIISDNKN